MSFSRIAKIISICGFIVVLVLGAVLISNSNEKVERTNEEVKEATANLDNVVRSQIQKCIIKYDYDTCIPVVLEYREACNTDLAYTDLPVCVDGTLEEYIQKYNP